MSFFRKLFGLGPAVDYSKLLAEGAVILDVRSHAEYLSGHIKGSVNMPLDTIKSGILKLKKENPFITCCASGMRSAVAKNILSKNGFTKVYNGGG